MGRSRSNGYGAAFIAVVASWLALSWPWLSGRVTIPYDAKAHFYPQLQFLAQALHTGQSPFWTPHIFAGSPQIADPQSLIFSPALLLALAVPNPSFRALDAYVLVLLLAAGLAVLLLFRDRGWHPAGAVVAALAYAFGGSAAWRIQHIKQVQSYALFAIALWLLARALKRGGVWRGVLAGLAAGVMTVEAGQVALLACYVLAAMVLWRPSSDEHWLQHLRMIAPALVASAVTVLAVVALPVLMTYEFVEASSRADIPFVDAGRGSLPPASLLTLIIGDLFAAGSRSLPYWGPPSPGWDADGLAIAQNMCEIYSGALVGVAFLSLGLLRGLAWRRDIRFYSLALLFSTLYALGWYTPVFKVLYDYVPAVHLFRRPADATFLMGGMLAIVGGYLVHVATVDGTATAWREMMAARRLLAAVFVAGVLTAVWKGHLRDALLPLAVSGVLVMAALALLSALPRLSSVAAVGFVALLTTVDLGVVNGPNGATGLPPSQYAMLAKPGTEPTVGFLQSRIAETKDPARRDRVELAGLGFEWPNAGMVHDLDHDLGYNPLRLATYADAVGAGDTIAVPEQRRFTKLFPGYSSLLARLLGLRYVAANVPLERIDPSLRPGDARLVATTASARIYELPDPLPRVLFAGQAQQADFARILRTGRWPSFDPRRTVLVDAASLDAPGDDSGDADLPATTDGGDPVPSEPAEATAGGAPGVRLVHYENTFVEIESTSPKPGYVVLADAWHPWWRGSVDGQPAPILKANVLFRAVAVPAGRHTVRFAFAPVAGAIGQVLEHFGRPRKPREPGGSPVATLDARHAAPRPSQPGAPSQTR